MNNKVLLTYFNNNSYLFFDKGKFDNFCVFISDNNKIFIPHDYQYFNTIKKYAKKYNSSVVYMIFLYIYINTDKLINYKLFNKIKLLCEKYFSPIDAIKLSKTFSILYATMVAEENKAFTKLGKRIKHLGIFLLLFENLSPIDAANILRNKKWQTIDDMCKKRNI